MSESYKSAKVTSLSLDFLIACTPGIVDNTLAIYPCDPRLLSLAEIYERHAAMQALASVEGNKPLNEALLILRDFFRCSDNSYWERPGAFEEENANIVGELSMVPDEAVDVWDSKFWYLNQFQVCRLHSPEKIQEIKSELTNPQRSLDKENDIKSFSGNYPESEEEIKNLLKQPRYPDDLERAAETLKLVAQSLAKRKVKPIINTLSWTLIQCYRADLDCCKQGQMPLVVRELISVLKKDFGNLLSQFETDAEKLCNYEIPRVATELQSYIDSLKDAQIMAHIVPINTYVTRRNGFAENPRSFLVWKLFEAIRMMFITQDDNYIYTPVKGGAKLGRRGHPPMPPKERERIREAILINGQKTKANGKLSVSDFCKKLGITQANYWTVMKGLRAYPNRRMINSRRIQ